MYDNTVIANCDGGARRNPGPAAIGIVLRDKYLYSMSYDGIIRKIDPSNGKEIWKFENYEKGHPTITIGLKELVDYDSNKHKGRCWIGRSKKVFMWKTKK